jgi:hypothetical protein
LTPAPSSCGSFGTRGDCVIWYLHLRPFGEEFVVHSHLDYEFEYEAPRDGEHTETDLDNTQEQWAAIYWCTPAFEEFAYRFWVENRLCRVIHGGDVSGLEPELRDYLRHYTPERLLA